MEAYDLYEKGAWISLLTGLPNSGTTASSHKCRILQLDRLKRLNEFLKTRQVAFMLNGVPHYPQYTGKWETRPHMPRSLNLHRESQSPDLNVFTKLSPILSNTKRHEYYADPTHFNEAGIQLWASTLKWNSCCNTAGS